MILWAMISSTIYARCPFPLLRHFLQVADVVKVILAILSMTADPPPPSPLLSSLHNSFPL